MLCSTVVHADDSAIATLYIGFFGATVSATTFAEKIGRASFWEMPLDYDGSIVGFLSVATGSYATLTDGDGSTGTITYPCHSGWIQATFPSAVVVTAVRVGGGNVRNVGTIAEVVNVSHIQYSTDNANWTTVWSIAGVSDAGTNQFVTFTLPAPITAQYWRIINFSYHTGTTEFKFQ